MTIAEIKRLVKELASLPRKKDAAVRAGKMEEAAAIRDRIPVLEQVIGRNVTLKILK